MKSCPVFVLGFLINEEIKVVCNQLMNGKKDMGMIAKIVLLSRLSNS